MKILSLALVGITLPLLAADQQPLIVFESAAVSVREVTPGGQVVLFAQISEPTGFVARLIHVGEILHDSDGDGVVTYPLESVPPRSNWVAVDLTTGQMASAIPPTVSRPDWAFHLLPASWLRRNRDGFLANLEARLPITELLWVRPGVGAWRTSVGDGGTTDRDGAQDGKSTVEVRDFAALRETDGVPPDRYKRGDILLAAHPWTLDLYAIALTND